MPSVSACQYDRPSLVMPIHVLPGDIRKIRLF
jgi:hypothetical protein